MLVPQVRPESVSEQFYRHLYLSLQRLRGRPIGSYLRQLQEWERLEPAAFQRLRAERLAQTLSYARERVPLYRSHQELRQGNGLELSAWPVLERETVQSRAPELLAQPVPHGHFFRLTSGSTGTPLGVAMDPSAAAWAWASDLRGLLWHGIGVGARCLSLRGSYEPVLIERLRNHMAIGAADLSEPRLTKAVRFLQRARPTFVWGFVSAVVELARHAQRTTRASERPVVPFAKVHGEMLYPGQRREIEEGLGARVIETYGCNEMGTVAYECPSGSLHVFSEHVEVEILNDGVPAGPGDTGEIVLTCTTNRVMPLVRYRVGDRGRFSPDPCRCGLPHPVICGIEGRVSDVLLTTTGARLHGTAVLGGLLKHLHAKAPTAIRQVRFEQHDQHTWTVLVQPGTGFGDAVATELVNSVKSFFGQDCRVRVQLVSHIPREASGKFRFYRVIQPKS
jgi:phenylacetate-CoA ligase